MTKNDNTPNTTAQKEWLTPNDVFEVYEISTSTQSKMRMKKKIPFSKIGRYIRYSRTEINKWLMSHSVEVA